MLSLMDFWNRLLIGGDQDISRRNWLWNVAGSGIYALASMLLGAAVTRTLGPDMGGIFFFAFSTFGQQMFIVSYFGMRPVQITDTDRNYSYGDYLRFRFLTAGLAVLMTAGYAFFFTESGTARTVLLLMAWYKILDGIADCPDCEFQRRGRLYLAGKSAAFRTLLSVFFFTAVMLWTRKLVPACRAALLSQGLGIFLFDLLPLSALPEMSGKSEMPEGPGDLKDPKAESAMAGLFGESFWLFLSAFLDLYIFAASKYAVNRLMTHAESGYYTTVFIPTSVINLMANFVIRPVLTELSELKGNRDRAAFLSRIRKISILILGFTVVSAAAAWFLGIPVLSLLVGPEAGGALASYRAALLIVILGGGFYAFLNLLYYVLVILKRQGSIFRIYVLCSAGAWLLSDVMTRAGGITGAACSYLICMAALAGLFLFSVILGIRRSL